MLVNCSHGDVLWEVVSEARIPGRPELVAVRVDSGTISIEMGFKTLGQELTQGERSRGPGAAPRSPAKGEEPTKEAEKEQPGGWRTCESRKLGLEKQRE